MVKGRGGRRGQAQAPRSCLGPVNGGGGWRRPPSPCEAARGSTGAPACAICHVRVSARVVGGACACAYVLVCVCVRAAVAFSGSVFCAQGPPRLWLPARSVVVRFGRACFLYDCLCISWLCLHMFAFFIFIFIDYVFIALPSHIGSVISRWSPMMRWNL